MAACDGRSVVGGIAEDSGKADVFDLDADAVVDVTPVPDADVVAVDVGAPDRSDAIVDTGLPYCTSDEQCGAGSGAPYCDPVLRQCVRCVPGERDRCPAAQHCDPMAFACVDGCRSDEGCAVGDGGVTDGGAAGAYCEVASHRCVQCVTSAQCAAGTVCAGNARATVTCAAGRCAIGACEAGYADCNRLAADGCETDTRSDAIHCGVCTNTGNDPANCGACGAACGAGLLCGGGACASTCSAGQTVCAGACATLATDNQHCGACGNRCAAGQQCTAGVCTLVCAAGTTSCGRVCANLLSDNTNCGRCGATCTASESCMGGVCTLVCPPTQTPCAGLCVDLTRDSNNCGACGMLCPTGCVAGRCASIVDIEAAQNNTCALYASGRVFCWGLNRGVNTRGGGSFAHNTNPVQVVDVIGAPLENVTQLAGGADAMCARRTNGTVQCWGNGLNITDVSAITTATDLAVRGVVGCAVVGGAVICWNSVLVTAPVAGISYAVAVAVGTIHNCAVRASGAVVCWGNNSYGQLGDGTVTARTGLITVGGVSDAVAITAGEHYTCARRRGGAVVCWGRNQSGQLGSGSTAAFSATPVEVMGLTGATLVRAGMRHACALAAGGALRCWGENTFSQVGDGATANRATPVAVAGLEPQRALALYATHACGLGVDGAVRCWGNNPSGEAGGGTETRSIPAAITGLNDVLDLQQGSGANVFTGAGTSWRCALRRGGTVACWGSASQGNASGQLGDGTTVNRTTPAPVMGLTDAVQISVGSAAACALRRGGSAVCWGYNAFGQIGDGTTVNRPLPTPVTGVPELAEIRTDGTTTCGRGVDGSVRCWGYNYWGQLGQGDQVPRPTPSVVAGVGTNARELWVGNGFVCARLAAGQVSCWGRNIEGQLADGSSTNRYLPGLVTTTASTVTAPVYLGGITALTQCGPLHCMARGVGATEVWDWGYTLGATRARPAPASANLVSFSTNYSWSTCATRTVTGTTATVCSGYAEFGLLGNGTAPHYASGSVFGGDRFARVIVSPNAYGPNCAVDTTGQAYCWGWTGDGSLAAAGLPGVNRAPTLVATP